MGRSVIRVVANGLQYGAWQGSYGSPSVTVLDGTAGNLLDDGPDGYVVQWDQAFRQDPDSPDGSLERLDGVAVFSEKTPSNSMLIGPFSVTSIIDQEEQDDQDDLDRHTIGPDEPEPKPFRPATADGPVPTGWREDCRGDLVAPDRSSVGYEPSCRHWFVFLSGGRMTPSPKYFTLRSEAVARLQELLSPEKPKPWCPEVGQWVRVSPDGEVGRVKHVTIESMYGYSPTRSITVVFPGRGPMPPFPPAFFEPWRPRVGERVAHNFCGLGVVTAVNPGDEKPIEVQIVCGHLLKASIGRLCPAPPRPAPAVGGEWRGVYPK